MPFLKYLKSFIFYKRFLLSFFIISNFVLWVANFIYFYDLLKIGGNFFDAVSTIYDISNTYNIKTFSILFISIFLFSLNIALLLKYISIKDKSKNNLESKISLLTMFFILLTAQCFSCSVAILGSLVSLSFLAYLPFAGLELSVAGIFILVYNNIILIRKINNPYVC